MPISPDQANQLLQSGQISQDTYNQIVPPQAPAAVPPPETPAAPTIAPSPATNTANSPNFATSSTTNTPSFIDKVVRAAPEAAQKTLDFITPTAEKAQVVANAVGLGTPAEATAPPASPTGASAEQKVAPSALISNQTQTAPNPMEASRQALEDIKSDTLQAQTNMQSANIALAKTAQQQAQAEYNAKVQGDKVLTDLQNQHLEQEKNQQAIINNKVLDMDQAAKDYTDMPPLDQNRYWNKASTGDKLLAGISVILGGIAQGKGEVKTNPGISYVNDAIDKDLESQKEMIARKKEAFNMQDSLLGRMYTRYGNWEQAELAAKNAALEGVQRKIDMASSQYNSPLIQQKANIANKQIDAQKQDIKLKFQELAQQSLNSPLMVGTGAEIPADPAIMARLPKEAKESAVKLPNGNFGIATSPKAAENLNEHLEQVQTLQDGIKELKQYATYGNKLPTADAARAETLRNSLLGQANAAFKDGRINAVTLNILNNSLPDPTKIISNPTHTINSLDTLSNALANETQNRMVQAGVSRRKVNFTPSK